ncbi:type III secretion system chaperone [Desulfocurvus sp. DL9XJH121]
MHIDAILDTLSARSGADLSLNGEGACRLVFDENVAVTIEADEMDDTVYLYTSFPLPPGDREALYARMLRANLFGFEAGGGAFALDEGRGEVVLNRVLHVGGMDAELFAGIVERFVEAAENWQRRQDEVRGEVRGEAAGGARERVEAGPGFIRA